MKRFVDIGILTVKRMCKFKSKILNNMEIFAVAAAGARFCYGRHLVLPLNTKHSLYTSVLINY